MVGYSDTPLATKLGIKEGSRLTLLSAPESLALDLPPGVVVSRQARGEVDTVVAFFTRRAKLHQRLTAMASPIFPSGSLWIAWPKRASGVPTDLTDTIVRDAVLPEGLVDNKVCAIDGTWSALRFVWRLENRGDRLDEYEDNGVRRSSPGGSTQNQSESQSQGESERESERASAAATAPRAAMAANASAVIVKAWVACVGVPLVPPFTAKRRPVSAKPNAVPIPRLMFKVPEAMPTCWGGAARMTVALFGDVNRPSPPPTPARSTTSPSAPGRSMASVTSPQTTTDMPLTVNKRGPIRSAIRPAIGATNANATGRAINSNPTRAEPNPSPRTR